MCVCVFVREREEMEREKRARDREREREMESMNIYINTSSALRVHPLLLEGLAEGVDGVVEGLHRLRANV